MQKSISNIQFRFFLFLTLVLISRSIYSSNQYNIVPYPQQLVPQSGQFVFNANTRVMCQSNQAEIYKLAQQFAAQLKLVSGINLKIEELKYCYIPKTKQSG